MAKAKEATEATEVAEDTGPRMAKRVTGVTQEAKLTVVATENPKRPSSSAYERFQHYLDDNPSTVKAAIEAGLTMGDIKYDLVHGSIEVEGAVIEEYEVKPRGPRTESVEAEVEADLEDQF